MALESANSWPSIQGPKQHFSNRSREFIVMVWFLELGAVVQAVFGVKEFPVLGMAIEVGFRDSNSDPDKWDANSVGGR